MNSPFEKRICFTVCICQMTAVLSCVSVVYLTVAVYKPAYLTLSSGFVETPVMCTTIANVTPADCDDAKGPGGGGGWNSCSEWCLSKSISSCPRIMVDVRQNGSNIRLEGCEGVEHTQCSGIDLDMKPRECVKGECGGMDGLFNCTDRVRTPGTGSDASYGAKCLDLNKVLGCNYTNTDDHNNCEKPKNCLKLNGTYDCRVGNCQRILPPFHCQRKCVGIRTANKTVIIREGDKIFSAQCERAMNISSGTEIWPLDFKGTTDPSIPLTLIMFCTNKFLGGDNRTFVMSDCFNGTLLEPGYFGETTDIIKLQAAHTESVDQGMYNRDIELKDENHGLVGPAEPDLLIYNNTKLYINYESCVNTLILNECEKFYAEYGGDGSDLKSQSRYRCFYAPDNPDFVTLRFSRAQTLLELMLATTIPITLAILSCFTLILCSRIIHVGDDSHFYFQCCGNDQQAALEKEQVEAMAL